MRAACRGDPMADEVPVPGVAEESLALGRLLDGDGGCGTFDLVEVVTGTTVDVRTSPATST